MTKKANPTLFKKLNDIANKAYVPYSNFHVSALFELKDGREFSGVNIENSSYPNTMCAERVGLYFAYNQNIDLREVKVIHIFSPDSKDILAPCGSCRQTLSEHIKPNTEIRMYDNKGQYISKKFSDILPFIIDPKNIRGEN